MFLFFLLVFHLFIFKDTHEVTVTHVFLSLFLIFIPHQRDPSLIKQNHPHRKRRLMIHLVEYKVHLCAIVKHIPLFALSTVNFDHFQILRAIGKGSFGKVSIALYF